MLLRIFKGVAGVAVWTLAVIGVLVLLMVWRVFSGGEPAAGAVLPVASPVAVVAPVAAAPVVAGLCPCDAGLVCTGPRGGRYCITAAGGKKYL